MPYTQTVGINRVRSEAELAALKSAWDRLAGGVPLRSYEWLLTWWQHYGASNKRAELYVLVATNAAGEVVGILPLYREHGPAGTHVLQLLGSGEVCTDYVTLMCHSAARVEIAGAMATWLCSSSAASGDNDSHDIWDVLKLDGVCEDDAGLHDLVDQLKEHDCLADRRAGENCWRLALPGTWDDYLACLSKSHRKQLRQLERRTLESDTAHVCWARDEHELFSGLEILIELHRKRRASLGEKGCFDSERFIRFLTDVSLRLLYAGQLRLGWLSIDGQPVAAEYQLLGQRATYAYQSGIDPAALEHEPGRLIAIAGLQASIGDRHEMFDFLRGNEPYKAHWRAVPTPTWQYRIAAPHTAARLRHNVWRAGQTLKTAIKSTFALSVSTSD